MSLYLKKPPIAMRCVYLCMLHEKNQLLTKKKTGFFLRDGCPYFVGWKFIVSGNQHTYVRDQLLHPTYKKLVSAKNFVICSSV